MKRRRFEKCKDGKRRCNVIIKVRLTEEEITELQTLCNYDQMHGMGILEGWLVEILEEAVWDEADRLRQDMADAAEDYDEDEVDPNLVKIVD